MFRRYQILIVIALAISIVAVAEVPKKNTEVWTWTKACPSGKQLRIQALVHEKIVFDQNVTICLMNRANIPDDKEPILKFFFTDKGAVFASERPVAGAGRLEGNIWLAGKEKDHLYIGVSVDGDNKILLNSIHIAYPDKPSESRYGGGLVVKTIPMN